MKTFLVLYVICSSFLNSIYSGGTDKNDSHLPQIMFIDTLVLDTLYIAEGYVKKRIGRVLPFGSTHYESFMICSQKALQSKYTLEQYLSMEDVFLWIPQTELSSVARPFFQDYDTCIVSQKTFHQTYVDFYNHSSSKDMNIKQTVGESYARLKKQKYGCFLVSGRGLSYVSEGRYRFDEYQDLYFKVIISIP